ncbi:hypothetical protein FRC97_00180 (plasmid) [Paracidovorax citrulli]|uniref:hypothetical protein n=1 Tax=Paracidovorax citrulli TaxID=80869 RepID=UPI000B23284D|nr:hypothetical protein [Paracidovorax citrulli]QCX13181.1 hypothetical protein APS58_p00037 [Paracidovorax citrulli]UMT93554.1 hypothetical protein FRC97_00180 [Paracidovorax citrulli]
MRNSIFEFYGLMGVFLVSSALILMIHQAFEMPEFVAALKELIPWLGGTAKVVAWAATGIILATSLAIPPLLMNMDIKDGGARMVKFGLLVWIILALISFGYLLSVAWLFLPKFLRSIVI